MAQGDGIGVLFLCTGNSARSLLAEAALARRGGARFRSYSAGSQPKGEPHPLTLETLDRLGYPTDGFRSKSWDEFAAPEAPRIDLVVTVCGNAANETCPVWPGHPVQVHWGVDDPAAFEGSRADALACFARIHDELDRKVAALVALVGSGLGEGEPIRLADRLTELRAIADL